MIRLSLNFSCGLLLIGPLIYPHLIPQEFHDLRQTNGFPGYVFITAAYINRVIRPSTFPIIDHEQKKVLRFWGNWWTGVLRCREMNWGVCGWILLREPPGHTQKVTSTILLDHKPNIKPNITLMKFHHSWSVTLLTFHFPKPIQPTRHIKLKTCRRQLLAKPAECNTPSHSWVSTET